jgi:host factor-I protein
MSKSKELNFQNDCLNQLRKAKKNIEVILDNGKKVKGIVKGFDNFTVNIESFGVQNLIFKHTIANLYVAPKINRKFRTSVNKINVNVNESKNLEI